MPTISRPADVGAQRAFAASAVAGTEIRTARQDRNLSLREIGRAVGLSASQVSRIERGLIRRVSVRDLYRLGAVVGLEMSVRFYPGGQPIRDAAHLALLGDLRAKLPRSLGWTAEAPLPSVGDRRAWDAVVRGPGWHYGVEAETAPRDVQGLIRRLALKQRDGHVDGVILLLRATATGRAFLELGREALASFFPVDGRHALGRLAAGADPGGNAIVVLTRGRNPSLPPMQHRR